MNFMDFYDLAVYANEAWKGAYSQREIVENAYTYWGDYLTSQDKCEPIASMIEILKRLNADADENVEALYYSIRIRRGIGGYEL